MRRDLGDTAAAAERAILEEDAADIADRREPLRNLDNAIGQAVFRA
ncbi:MAG: hypothetical protein AAGC86_18200 [Pseudomonadota bacterium]